MQRLLRTSLTAHGYRHLEANRGRQAVEFVATHNPDLVLLDLCLPDMDGLEVTAELRGWSSVPIIVLSAIDREEEKVRALDTGADDYVTKPFGERELLARIRSVLRKAQRDEQGRTITRLSFGDLLIDMVARRVRCGEREVHLTPTQFKLLSSISRTIGKALDGRAYREGRFVVSA